MKGGRKLGKGKPNEYEIIIDPVKEHAYKKHGATDDKVMYRFDHELFLL